MTIYVVNEEVSEAELAALKERFATLGDHRVIRRWPEGVESAPDDLELSILIVREASTKAEESRCLSTLNVAKQIVCIFMGEIENVSEAVQKYCSAKVTLDGSGLGEAIAGNERVQEDSRGRKAPKNPQKPHRC